MKPLPTRLALVVPAYNEANNIHSFVRAIELLQLNELQIDPEILFVNDGSRDNTVERVTAVAHSSKIKITLIDLSRNFGKEAAVSAGLSRTAHDAVVIIDCDLQHPPALIPEMIRRWRAGAEIVASRRLKTEKQSVGRRAGSALFHLGMRMLSDVKFETRTTDFRLLDAQVVSEINRFTERNRLVRGLIDWVGFRREVIEFEAPAREEGETGFSYAKLIDLAINGLVSFSLKPLRFTAALGVSITILSAVVFLVSLLDRVFFGFLSVTNLAMVAIFNSFLIGVVLVALGLVAVYVGHIQSEVLNRPLFIIRREIGSKDK